MVPPWLVCEPICAVGFPSIRQPGLPVRIVAPQAVMSPTVAMGRPSHFDWDATLTIGLGPWIGQMCLSPRRAVGFMMQLSFVALPASNPTKRSNHSYAAKVGDPLHSKFGGPFYVQPKIRVHGTKQHGQLM